MGEFVACIDQVKADLSEYRTLSHPVTGVDRRALWPKTFTPQELEKLRKSEENKNAREEAAAEEKRKLEEEKLAAAAPAKKGVPPKKGGAAEKPGSRGNLSSAASGEGSKRRDVIKDLLAKQKLTSCDDVGDKNFSFKALERVMTEMDGASTNIGGILSAMVYQIEQDNIDKNKKNGLAHNASVHEDLGSLQGGSLSNLPSNMQSIDMQTDQGK